jgi:hypothetical protein
MRIGAGEMPCAAKPRDRIADRGLVTRKREFLAATLTRAAGAS